VRRFDSSRGHSRGEALYRPGVSRVDDGRTQKERLEAGELYLADDPVLQDELRRAALLTRAFNDSSPDDAAGRRQLLEELLGSLGEGAHIRPPLYCDYGFRLHVGARSFVNFGLVALDVATIAIGEDAQVGPNVQLLTATHPLEPEPRRAGWESGQPIAIGDNAWLGGGVIVCPGVTIGADTVVGAGSVVTRDLPAGVLAAGSPARVLRELY
jgi:maltose O-acetyltransferase